MAIREYVCPNCDLHFEKLIPTQETPASLMECPRCGHMAQFQEIPSSVGISTTNFSERTIDVAIGADAERRWEDIHQRQAQRDRVRQESQQVGISMTGRSEFTPLTPEDHQRRGEALDILAQQGHKLKTDNDTDKRLLGLSDQKK